MFKAFAISVIVILGLFFIKLIISFFTISFTVSFTVIMPNLNYNGTQDDTQDGTQDDVYTLILEMIKRNNKISAKQLAEKLGISIRTVRRKIKEMNNIEYIGHGYSGYCKIKK